MAPKDSKHSLEALFEALDHVSRANHHRRWATEMDPSFRCFLYVDDSDETRERLKRGYQAILEEAKNQP